MIDTFFLAFLRWVFLILNVIGAAHGAAHGERNWLINAAVTILALALDSKWRASAREKHKRQLGGKR